MKNIKRENDGFWTVGDISFSSAKIRLRDDKDQGILDHDFYRGRCCWRMANILTSDANREGFNGIVDLY